MNNWIEGSISVDKLLAFLFGFIFCVVLLVFAVAIPEPTTFTQFVFRVVLSLAAAGIGAVLPGLLEITIPGARAGGALALAAMVYFLNPPALISDSVEKKTTQMLDSAYALINRGNMDRANELISKARLLEPEPLDVPFS